MLEEELFMIFSILPCHTYFSDGDNLTKYFVYKEENLKKILIFLTNVRTVERTLLTSFGI